MKYYPMNEAHWVDNFKEPHHFNEQQWLKNVIEELPYYFIESFFEVGTIMTSLSRNREKQRWYSGGVDLVVEFEKAESIYFKCNIQHSNLSYTLVFEKNNGFPQGSLSEYASDTKHAFVKKIRELTQQALSVIEELTIKHVMASFHEQTIVQLSNNDSYVLVKTKLPIDNSLTPSQDLLGDYAFSLKELIFKKVPAVLNVEQIITLGEKLDSSSYMLEGGDHLGHGVGGDNRSPSQIIVQFRPMVDDGVIAVGEFTGYGSHESGGYRSYPIESLLSSESLISLIKRLNSPLYELSQEIKDPGELKLKLIKDMYKRKGYTTFYDDL